MLKSKTIESRSYHQKMSRIIDFSKLKGFFNEVYWPYLNDFRYWQVFKGGGSAGKSVFISDRMIYHICSHFGYNVLCLRKTKNTIHNSCFTELKKTIIKYGLTDFFKINNSKGDESITFKANGNKILFAGLDDPEKLKSITFENGPLVCIWYEEASEGLETEVDNLSIRLRGRTAIPKHFILSFNPIDQDHWLKKRFFDTPLDPKDGFTLETTYHDNRFLMPEDRANLEALKDRDYYYYMVYALNQWGYRTGTTVFHNLKIHDFDIPEFHYRNIRHGLDFGFNHASAFIGSGYIENELYIFREEYAKNLLNAQFIELIDNSKFDKIYPVVADSANPDKISEFGRAGYRVSGAMKGPGSLVRGIDYLKSLKTIHIHKTNCPNAAREFSRFKYRQFKDGRVSDTEYVEIDDDTIAATRYGNEEFFNSGPNVKTAKPFTRRVV